ncbi:hypothetical protein Pmar_PMAR025591, partial [Perkinsus marinus ATCC 50983]
DREFTEEVLVEFGAHPNIINFSSAVAVCRERNPDPSVLRDLFDPLTDSEGRIQTECLDYLLRRSKEPSGQPSFSEEEITDLLEAAVDENGTKINVNDLCNYLIKS